MYKTGAWRDPDDLAARVQGARESLFVLPLPASTLHRTAATVHTCPSFGLAGRSANVDKHEDRHFLGYRVPIWLPLAPCFDNDCNGGKCVPGRARSGPGTAARCCTVCWVLVVDQPAALLLPVPFLLFSFLFSLPHTHQFESIVLFLADFTHAVEFVHCPHHLSV